MIFAQVGSIFSIILVLFFVTYGGAITCYVCNSRFDPRCGDPFDPYGLGVVDCSLQARPEHINNSLEATLCRKNIEQVYGKLYVDRSCGYIRDEKYDEVCVRTSGTHDVSTRQCSCSTNLCNAASIEVPQMTIFWTLAIILVWMIK